MLMTFSPASAPGDNRLMLLRPEPTVRGISPKTALKAIIQVETGNNGSGAYNRTEPQAKGILQQWPIMVRDVNRILGHNKYSLADRLIPGKAIEMFWIYQEHYNPEMDFEKMCRIQCGGPDGYLQNCTLQYLELVKKQLYTN